MRIKLCKARRMNCKTDRCLDMGEPISDVETAVIDYYDLYHIVPTIPDFGVEGIIRGSLTFKCVSWYNSSRFSKFMFNNNF